MAKPDFNLCDICGEKTDRKNTVYILKQVYDSRCTTDPGPRESGKFYDLCPAHMAWLATACLQFDVLRCSEAANRGDFTSELGTMLIDDIDKMAQEKKG